MYAADKQGFSLPGLLQIRSDLAAGDSVHVAAGKIFSEPVRRELNRFFLCVAWSPANRMLDLAIIEPQRQGLVQTVVTLNAVGAAAQRGDENLRKGLDRDGMDVIRSEIEGGCEGRTIGMQPRRQHQIAAYYLDDMLPGTDSVRRAQHHCFSARHALDDIWNQSVFREITATDDITCSR